MIMGKEAVCYLELQERKISWKKKSIYSQRSNHSAFKKKIPRIFYCHLLTGYHYLTQMQLIYIHVYLHTSSIIVYVLKLF